MFLYVFLEKTKLKDVSSNDADLVHDVRIILIGEQKNYVLDAPLGDRPNAGANIYSLRPKILVVDLSKYRCIKSRFSIRYIRI